MRNRAAPLGIISLAEYKFHQGGMAKRQVAHIWTNQEDALLKQVQEKYPGNWLLIAEAFNSCRVTISTDKRTALDCYTRHAQLTNAPNEEEHRVPQTPTTQMTTRGVKRSIGNATPTSAISLNMPNGPQSIEPKKRRHNLMFDAVRKASRKRETLLKQQCTQWLVKPV